MLTVSGRVVDWMVFYSDCNHFCHRLEKYTNILSMIDKESVILSTVSTVFAPRKQGDIKKVSVLTRLPHLLALDVQRIG